MLSFLPGPLLGVLSMLFFVVNTIFWHVIFLPIAFLKLIIPIDGWRRFTSKVLIEVANCWIDGNTLNFWLTQKIDWQVDDISGLKPDAWYLIIANHRNWIDIPVMQRIFNRKIPFLKFFLKKELIKVPLLGLAWWALDFPFMRRFSRAYLEKHPEMRGKDFETIRKACQIFKRAPVSVINYLEGTRFSLAKREQQRSPYRHLLLPKAGGIAAVISEMGDYISGILNITIIYSEPDASLWDLMTGKLRKIIVRVELLPVPTEMIGKDYNEDLAAQRDFQNWVNNIWQEKDDLIEQTMKHSLTGSHY